MSPAGHSRITEVPGAQAALLDVCRPFVHAESFDPQCHVVHANEIPHPADELLVHHEHMTVALQRHHGSPVEVHVLEEHLDADGDLYTRKISLTAACDPSRVVEWGIVRMDLRYVSDEVRAEILKKKLPLGAVLIKHDVHRRIKPRFFLRFPPGGPVLRMFGAAGTGPVYGRLGTIYCDEEPAIELLEIVTGIEVTP